MSKRIGIVGVVFVAMLALSGLGAAGASASFCALVSNFQNKVKGGNWPTVNNLTGQCQGPEQSKLTARWVLVEVQEQNTVENLFCAKLLLSVGEAERENGYFKEEKCAGGVLAGAQENKSDYTEVIIPQIPGVLPAATGTLPLTASSSSGTSTFGSGLLEITSSKSKGTLTGNSPKLGSFNLEFEESKNVLTGVKCTGLADAGKTGLILVAGTFHYRDYKEGTTLRTAAVFLLVPVHFECGGVTLVVVSGCVAGALTPESVLTKTLTVTLAKTGKDNTIVTILNEANTENELCQLLAGISGATATLSAEVTTQTLTGFKQNGTSVEVLVMPL